MTAIRTIRAGDLRARFSAHRQKRISGPSLGLPNYWQEDYHSCGYLAALTVAEYLRPGTDPAALLATVRPGFDTGTTRHRVIKGLASVGVSAVYRDDLTIWDLYLHVLARVPIIISVFPEWWDGDHWTVVQGFSTHRVYVTNHYSLPLGLFLQEWVDNWGDGCHTGAGLVCRREE